MRPRLQKMPREPAPLQAPTVMENELRQMISEAAYYLAEKRGFVPGLEGEDWRQAEQEVLARVRESKAASRAWQEHGDSRWRPAQARSP